MVVKSICIKPSKDTIPIYLISCSNDIDKEAIPKTVQVFVTKLFEPVPRHPIYCHYNDKACLQFVICCVKDCLHPQNNEVEQLLAALPDGIYHVKETTNKDSEKHFALVWMRQQYVFDDYLKQEHKVIADKQLKLSYNDPHALISIVETEFYACNLINTPANDLAPHNIEEEASRLAEKYGAEFRSYVGDDLLIENFPLIHAVGAGSHRLPRLVEFFWGNDEYPLVSLIGKGVSFDSGGLNIKPESGMRIMKKDMGGAAHILALSQRIMKSNLPVRLHVLLPCAENSISSHAFRPGDIYSSRAGLSVEIGHTDAEGRLILADAINYAREYKPQFMLIMATLTGAARVALGPDIVPYFTNHESFDTQFKSCYHDCQEAFWRLPLHQDYSKWLKTKHADISSVGDKPFAGSITAALFLEKFVGDIPFIHCDIYAWDADKNQAQAQGLDSLFHFLKHDLF